MHKSPMRRHSAFSSSRLSAASYNFSSSLLSRKSSSAVTGASAWKENDSTLIDQGKLDGKIKIHSIIKNSDYCTSVNYRPDGRFYAVSLANGIVNVYSSKTNNILYTLNNEDMDLPYTSVSATCVRFRPCDAYLEADSTQLPALSKTSSGVGGRRRSSGAWSAVSDSEHFLPPLMHNKSSLSPQTQQYVQRRRKSSVSALGLRSSEVLGLFSDRGSETYPQSNLVTASFTNGSVKTFNFLTEQCMQEVKEDREILTIAYSKSGNMMASGGSDGKIYLYDSQTNELKSNYNPPFEYNDKLLRTYSIAFHSQSENEFIAAGWNKKIQFYDARVANLMVSSIEGPKVTGEGLAFHPSGDKFCVAARDRKRCIEVFSYGEKRSFGNVLDNFMSDSNSKRSSLPQKREAVNGSLFHYAVRYLDSNFIAFCGSHPGALVLINEQSKKATQLTPSITGLKNSVNCIDNFRKKIVFVVRNEVACAEIFE